MENKYLKISKMPTVLDIDGVGSYHESILRSYHVLEEVRKLLQINTPNEVILDLIEIMESGEAK
jgi:hypothetical protein